MTSLSNSETQQGGKPASSVSTRLFQIQVVDRYSAVDKCDLAGGEKDPSQTASYGLQWRPTERHLFLLREGTRVCHVGLVEQLLQVQENSVAVAGIGGVLVRSGCRGNGYCRIAMEAAEAFVQGKMSARFLLLFCRPAVQSLYEHLGWAKVSSPVWVQQPQGIIVFPLASMVKRLSAERWPDGEVRVGSPPW